MSATIFRRDSGDGKEILFRGVWYVFEKLDGKLYARRRDDEEPTDEELENLFRYLRHEGWDNDDLPDIF